MATQAIGPLRAFVVVSVGLSLFFTPTFGQHLNPVSELIDHNTIKSELLSHMGLEEEDFREGTEAPLPAYVQSLYQVLEAAVDKAPHTHSALPWLLGEKMVMAAVVSKMYQNETDTTFTFTLHEKRPLHLFNGGELVLPVGSVHALGLKDITWACVFGGKCQQLKSSRRSGWSKSLLWNVFDITPLLKHCLDPQKPCQGNPKITVTMTHTGDTHEKESFKDSVYLVMYTNYPGLSSMTSIFQELLYASPGTLPVMPDSTPSQSPRFRRDDDTDDVTLCRLFQWQVSIEEMNWKHKVKQPSVLQTNYCSGTCREPLDIHAVNATNHAFVKSLYRSYFSQAKVPPSFCVPTKFRPVNMVFYDAPGITITKSMYNVLATECACM